MATEIDKNRDIVSCSFSSCEKIYGAETNISALRSGELFNICLVVSGSGIHQVLDQEIPCTKGDICIIPPKVPHSYFLTEKSGEISRNLRFQFIACLSLC